MFGRLTPTGWKVMDRLEAMTVLMAAVDAGSLSGAARSLHMPLATVSRKISELGRNLYDAVRVLGGHFDTLGARLKSSLDAYNQAVGSLEGNVLVKARKLRELQPSVGEEIKTLEAIDRVPRMLQSGELTDGLPFADDPSTVETV